MKPPETVGLFKRHKSYIHTVYECAGLSISGLLSVVMVSSPLGVSAAVSRHWDKRPCNTCTVPQCDDTSYTHDARTVFENTTVYTDGHMNHTLAKKKKKNLNKYINTCLSKLFFRQRLCSGWIVSFEQFYVLQMIHAYLDGLNKHNDYLQLYISVEQWQLIYALFQQRKPRLCSPWASVKIGSNSRQSNPISSHYSIFQHLMSADQMTTAALNPFFSFLAHVLHCMHYSADLPHWQQHHAGGDLFIRNNKTHCKADSLWRCR